MRKCWLEKPEERPSFHALYDIFDKMLVSQSDYFSEFEFADATNYVDPDEDSVDKNNDAVPPSYDDEVVAKATQHHDEETTSFNLKGSYVDMNVKVTKPE